MQCEGLKNAKLLLPLPWVQGRGGALLCLLAVFIAAGCRVDQKKEVEIYREVTDLREGEYDPAKSLTLQDALLLANRGHEDIAAQGEQYLRALIDRRRTAAGFLPTVNLVASYLKRDPVPSNNNDNGGGGGSNSQNSSFDVSADLNWELFNGFQDVNRYWRDTYLIAQRRNALLSFQESLLLDVAGTYYQILRSEASVRVLENSLQVQEERLRDTRGRLDAGVARPLDLAQTEAQVSATRTTLINARRDVRNARDLLALLTNASVSEAELSARRVAMSKSRSDSITRRFP